MFIPQLQTKTPIRGSSVVTSISSGSSTDFVSVLRAPARFLPDRQAAALASMTELGISLGPWNTPQAYTPALDVSTGLKGSVAAKLY